MTSNRENAPDHVLLTCGQMARADSWTIDNGYASGFRLMENAGARVAKVALERFGDAARVSVLCGPGNNGGDGYVAAQILLERGVEVEIFALGESGVGTDAEIALARCSIEPRSIIDFTPKRDDLVIDALFGAGLTRSLPDIAADALNKAAGAGCRVIAVDLPSGINGDSGRNVGGAIAADATVTFFRKKPGHLLFPGRTFCGEVTVADIGVRGGIFNSEPPLFFENAPALWRSELPDHEPDTYKYARGHVAVYTGPRHATGASRLSAMAAQRAGAGAVTILGKADALDIHATHMTSIMLREYENGGELTALHALNRCRACVLGPGFGYLEQARMIAEGVLKTDSDREIFLVLDADGITAFADCPERLFAASGGHVEPRLVLTPHDGEFARLFPDIADKEMSKLEKALEAAARANAVVIYKGPDSVIAAPDGFAAINTNATSALATAGSGDVLTGIVASLLAQGMPIWGAACAATWAHGEAGKAAGKRAIAEDIVVKIAAAMR
jgi:ADP-dependent NAD(P)H-hydrate dehydratase / NAD(P)H-hydrate epimerase